MGVPETWDDVFALDEAARSAGMSISLPNKAVDTLGTLLTLLANSGTEPYQDEEQLAPRAAALEKLALSRA